jgi:putative ABC transport system permease protein
VNQIGDIALITASILGAVFFTILLVTGNTISQSVRERTGELGVLKAIGFTNGQVLALILTESCLLAVLGGVLGLGIGKLLTAGGDPTGGMLPLFYFPTRDLLVGLALSVALGLITGFFPALQAMRLQVADALRRI